MTSTTDTDVVFSYDADWGNVDSHAPYTYDYFSQTLRNRKSFGQEFRLVSNENFEAERFPFSWVIGLSYLKLDETNDRQDDGLYGDPQDPFSPYSSLNYFLERLFFRKYCFFGNLEYDFRHLLKFPWVFVGRTGQLSIQIQIMRDLNHPIA